MFLIALLGLPSLAFAPSDEVYQGVTPERIRRYHVERQHSHRHGEAWQSFVQGEGAGWQARFDEVTGTPHRAWGPGIPMGTDAATVEQNVQAFLARNSTLLGVGMDGLRLGSVQPVKNGFNLRFDQVVPGSARLSVPSATDDGGLDLDELSHGEIDVLNGQIDLEANERSADLDPGLAQYGQHGEPQIWDAGVHVRVRHGNLIMLGVDTWPGADQLDTEPVISAETAVEIAMGDGPEPGIDHEVDGAVLTFLPVGAGSRYDLHLAWMVRTNTHTAEPGQWVSFVDARTGDLLHVYNNVRYMSGTVYGTHDTRTVDGNSSTSALPYIGVATSADSTYTDENGSYALDGSPATVTMVGRHFRVRNQAGSGGALTWSGGDATITEADATLAEIDSYLFLNEIYDWAQDFRPELGILSRVMNSNVNLNSSCNAYFDGDVNFYQAGSGCNNTGRIADVNYHEWGHGLHYSAANSWNIDGSIGEGAGDITAFLQTGDSTIAPYFMTNGSGIRDAAPNRVYPDDIVGEVHYDGLIFAGAVWDLYGMLIEDFGEDEAYELLSDLFIGGLEGNPELETSYDEMVAADDDNGDLGDGTPNQCALIESFSLHGLGPNGSASIISIAHEPVGNQDADAKVEITAEIVNTAEACSDSTPTSGEIVYSIDGGESWDTAELEGNGADWEGAIPAQAHGTIVHYYVLTETDDGSTTAAPSGEAINPFSFFVGELEELYCNDFEDDDGGFTHELLSGSSDEGADDWQWGRPLGEGGDPDFAASGDNVWGNDLGADNYNGEYQDDKQNRLTSPAIDIGGHDKVIVQFRRWLTVEDGYYDRARVLANGDTVWENHGSDRNTGDEHHEDEQWSLTTLEVELDGASTLELGWEIESDGGLTKGGWNIDDVCIYAIGDAPENDPGDDGEGGEDGEGGDARQERGAPAEGSSLSACACSSSEAPAGSFLGILALAGLALLRRRRAS